MKEGIKKFVDRRILRKENPNLGYRVGLTLKPDYSLKELGPILRLSYRGEEVGTAQLLYDGEKKYILNRVDVHEQFRGNDFGGNLIDAVNNFLDEQGAEAKLANQISNPLKMGLYRRHGWKYKPITGGGWWYYTPKQKNL